MTSLTDPPKCPKCGGETEKTQVFENYAAFVDDGPYRWVWKCKKCGHELTEEEVCGYTTCNCVGCM